MQTHDNPRRHLILLIALLLIIVLSPFVVTLRHGVTILNIVGAAVLLSATYAVSERRHFLAIAVILSATSIITTGLLVAFPSYWLVLGSHGSLVVLTGFFAFTILGYVVRSGKITSDKIYGAICVYLLFGYAWTFACFWTNCSQDHLPLRTRSDAVITSRALCSCGILAL